MTSIDNVGARIRMARESLGISQKRLGFKLGLSDKAISAYESSRIYPPLDTLNRLAIELNKDITYFFVSEKEALILTKYSKIENLMSQLIEEIKGLKGIK